MDEFEIERVRVANNSRGSHAQVVRPMCALLDQPSFDPDGYYDFARWPKPFVLNDLDGMWQSELAW